jgi:hypothetical protein
MTYLKKKKYAKSKRKTSIPKRYVNPNRRRPIPNYKSAWEALNVMNDHYRVHTNKEQVRELNKFADDREFRYGTGPLSNPFNLDDSFLIHYKNQAAMENWPYTEGHGGHPFNLDPDQKWLLDYNKHLIHDFNKHIKTRTQHRDYERLENNILYKFKW